MGAEGIFLIRNGELVLLEQRPYDSEAVLQEALASFPAVLAGSSTVDDLPASRLLLVAGDELSEGPGSPPSPRPSSLLSTRPVCATAHKTPDACECGSTSRAHEPTLRSIR